MLKAYVFHSLRADIVFVNQKIIVTLELPEGYVMRAKF